MLSFKILEPIEHVYKLDHCKNGIFFDHPKLNKMKLKFYNEKNY